IHLLDVIGLVADGKLQVSWMYSSEQYKHSTINQVAVSFKQYLNQLLAMQPDKNHMYIPSDFPLCQLTQNDLNVLISDRTDVESIYPLSPLQKGMLFHTYLSEEGGDYISQWSTTLQGNVQVDVFKDAWNHLIQHHSVFRTAYKHDASGNVLSVVYNDVQAAMEFE